MCARKPSLKKNDSAIKRNSIYKNSHCGREVASDQVFFSLNMQHRRGHMHDFRCRHHPYTTHRVWSKCGCSFSVVLMEATIQRSEWCCLVLYSKPVVSTSSCSWVCTARAYLAQNTSSFSGIFWAGPIHTADSLHGGRRKGITRVRVPWCRTRRVNRLLRGEL